MNLEELEKEVTRLEDIQSIENLQRMYGYYFDTGQHRKIVQLFSEKTKFVEIESHGRFNGLEGVKKMFWYTDDPAPPPPPKSRPRGIMTVIMQLGGVVNIAPDGKTATGRWQTWLAETFPFAGKMGQYWLQGYYENEYIKEDGKWLFTQLYWNTTFYTRFETGWLTQPIVGFLPRNEADSEHPTAFYPYPSGYKFPYSFKHPITEKEYDPGDTYVNPMSV